MDLKKYFKISNKNGNLKSLQSELNINRITMVVLIVLIVITAVFKIVRYFGNEKVSYDKNAISISQSSVNTGELYLMQFNSELIMSSEEVIFVDYNNNEALVNFTSAPSNKVLVRAEIFTDVSNLKKKINKKLWTTLLYPNDKRLVRIGDTGWIESGKIVEKIKLDELPNRSCPIAIRFTAVNPANTKTNAGMFSMNTNLVVVDYKGNMLDENGVWQNLNSK